MCFNRAAHGERSLPRASRMGSDQPPSWRQLLSGFDVREVAPATPEARVDVATATIDALESAGLADFARGAASEGRSLTLLVNDTHRFTDTRSFLEAVLHVLGERLAGERPPPLRVLVATGSHVSTEDERRAHEEAMFGEHA